MEVGDKLKELNMTAEEVDRLNKAFKDETFREMLRDYAQELADPGNKKRYEEEIKLMEQERGNSIEFIHPEPFRALGTSVDGKHKCFINICASGKVGKPECKWGLSEEGKRGQCWSLPHSLHPGRQDTDPKGNRITIYDVVFHPDTLHIASKNGKFMAMVDGAAMEGIESNFQVTLDKNNARELRAKYKGTPQPCVLRKPIPGYKHKEALEKPDPLAFPYPDSPKPTESQRKNPDPGSKKTNPAPKTSDPAPDHRNPLKNSDAPSKNPASAPTTFKIQPHHTKEPTKPNYTVKYRSFIDLQDFRCSRDSAQSPRPREIVVTVNLPLLKGVADVSLEVEDEKLLLLESKEPAYRLELPLAYPVDEDKGEAKFNKQIGQLTVTLPVLPSDEAFHFTQAGLSDLERQGEGQVKEGQEAVTKENMVEEEKEDLSELKEEEEEGGNDEKKEAHVEEEEALKENEEEEGVKGGQRSARKEKNVANGVEEREREERLETLGEGQESGKGEESVKRSEEEGGRGREEGEEWVRQGKKDVEEMNEMEKCEEQTKEGGNSEDIEEKETNVEKLELIEQKKEKCKGQGEKEDQKSEEEKEEEEENEGISLEENITDETESWKRNEETALEEKAKWNQQERQRKENAGEEELQENRQENEIEGKRLRAEEKNDLAGTGVSRMASLEPGHQCVLIPEGCKVEDKNQNMETSSEMKPSDVIEKVDSGTVAAAAGTSTPTDPRPALFPLPAPLLREIDKDGNEKVIRDYTTSAEFIFHNTVMFELD